MGTAIAEYFKLAKGCTTVHTLVNISEPLSLNMGVASKTEPGEMQVFKIPGGI